MTGVITVAWLIMALVTARVWYMRWRPAIIARGRKGSYVVEDPGIRCGIAAIVTVWTCLSAWWFVGLVLIVMARPRATETERQQEMRRETVDLEAEAEQLRAELAKLRGEQT
jgi:hypothetical protein